MLVICYGMHKTASTFTWTLARDYLRAHAGKRIMAPADVVDCDAAWLAAQRRVIESRDRVLIVKTHRPAAAELHVLARRGLVAALANYRDPRDMALSMLDAGRAERAAGNDNVMSAIHGMEDAIATIRREIPQFLGWAEASFCLPLEYEDICFDTVVTATGMAEHIAGRVPVSGDVARIVDGIDRSGIRLNRACRKRHRREMNPAMQRRFGREFGNYMRRYRYLG